MSWDVLDHLAMVTIVLIMISFWYALGVLDGFVIKGFCFIKADFDRDGGGCKGLHGLGSGA